jgi:MoxR-like ATPase
MRPVSVRSFTHNLPVLAAVGTAAIFYLKRNLMTDPLLIAKNAEHELFLLPQMGNRHGLITGATGTGKTVTLQALAQAFSRIGVPVFVSDVKGDLSGSACLSQFGGRAL